MAHSSQISPKAAKGSSQIWRWAKNEGVMATKGDSKEVELKVRIPKELMAEVNDFRHEKKLDSRKKAVEILLEKGLSNGRERKKAETANPE